MQRRSQYPAVIAALLLGVGCAGNPPRSGTAGDASSSARSQSQKTESSERKLAYPAEPEETETTSGDEQIAALKLAAAQYRTFVQKARDQPEYAAAVKRAQERIEDIRATIDFLQNAPAAPPTGSSKPPPDKRSFADPNLDPPSP